MSLMGDPRNRRALIASFGGGVAAFLGAWLLLGLSPLPAWIVGWTLPAFAMYGIDKRQAVNGGWRVPEIVLHALALTGGVVGAWAGRAVFRHKTQKPIFLGVLIASSVLWGVIALWALTR